LAWHKIRDYVRKREKERYFGNAKKGGAKGVLLRRKNGERIVEGARHEKCRVRCKKKVSTFTKKIGKKREKKETGFLLAKEEKIRAIALKIATLPEKSSGGGGKRPERGGLLIPGRGEEDNPSEGKRTIVENEKYEIGK